VFVRQQRDGYRKYLIIQFWIFLTTCFAIFFYAKAAESAKHSQLGYEAESIRMAANVDGRITDTNNGRAVFESTCAFCHGLQGEGGLGGGVSLFSATNLEVVMDRVRNGLEIMPGFAGSLTEEEIQDVSAYVVEELPH